MPVLGGVVAETVAGSQATIVRSEPPSDPPIRGGIPGYAESSLRTESAPSNPRMRGMTELLLASSSGRCRKPRASPH